MLAEHLTALVIYKTAWTKLALHNSLGVSASIYLLGCHQASEVADEVTSDCSSSTSSSTFTTSVSNIAIPRSVRRASEISG